MTQAAEIIDSFYERLHPEKNSKRAMFQSPQTGKQLKRSVLRKPYIVL